MREACVGLAGLDTAGLTHGFLDLRQWRIAEDKRVRLCAPLPEVCDRMVPALRVITRP